MDNKTTENLIQDILNAEKPDKKVLVAAKEIVAQNKPSRKNTLRFYILAGCSVVLIAVGIVFLIPRKAFNSYTLSIFEVSVKPYGLIIGVTLILSGILSGVFAVILKIKKGR